MEQIGDLYSEGKIYLPELLLASDTVKPIFDYINQFIGESETKKGKGSYCNCRRWHTWYWQKYCRHSVKKLKLWSYRFRKGRWNTKKIVEAVRKEKPQILGLSAMMTTTIGKIEEVVNEVRKLSFLSNYCQVGGASNEQTISK